MSELALPALAPTAAYPEQEVARPGLLDRLADGIAAPVVRRLTARKAARVDIAAAVRRFAARMRTDDRTYLTYYAWQVYVSGRRITGPR